MSKRKPLNRGKQKENRPSQRGAQQGSRQGSRQESRKGTSESQSEPSSWSPAKRSRPPAKGPRDSAQTRRRPDRDNRKADQPTFNASNKDWLYGVHPVHEALKNPQRTLHRLVATAKAAQTLSQEGLTRIHPELATGDKLVGLLPEGAVHQGLALHVAPLPDLDIEDIVTPLSESEGPALLFLDQVSDPHNVGAIIRSAAAFGASAVIVQDRHAPQITGTLAKSASGAVEHVPLIRVTNLARALEAVADAGYFRVGLAGEAEEDLGKTTFTGKIALVLGAEGPGLRRLTREKCDLLVKLPTHEPISSLNVSNAAAVSLFAIATPRG